MRSKLATSALGQSIAIDDWRNVPPSGRASCGFLRFGAMDHLAVRRVDRNTHN